MTTKTFIEQTFLRYMTLEHLLMSRDLQCFLSFSYKNVCNCIRKYTKINGIARKKKEQLCKMASV